MTPSRVPGSQNLRFDRVFPAPVGRLVNSSGTSDPKRFAEYDLLLTKLWRAGQVDALLAIKRGELAMPEVQQADREQGLAHAGLVAALVLRKPLWATIDALLPKPPRATTRRRYWISLQALRQVAPSYLRGRGRLDERAAVSDLARVDWKRLAAWWIAPVDAGGRGRSGTDWMHLRRAVSLILTEILGDVYHPYRRGVVGAMPTAAEAKRTPDLTPAEFWAICERVSAPVCATLVTLVSTGARYNEYDRLTPFQLTARSHRVALTGRKGGSTGEHGVMVAAEYWRYVEAAVPAKRRYRAVYNAFKKAARAIGRGEITVHDLRHCYVQWGLKEGAPIPAAQEGARHADVRMTMRYASEGEKGVMGEAVGRALTKGRKPA